MKVHINESILELVEGDITQHSVTEPPLLVANMGKSLYNSFNKRQMCR
ncbi:MAG: hypothetical protein ACE5GO_11345 [Anaerolineales bacterium]